MSGYGELVGYHDMRGWIMRGKPLYTQVNPIFTKGNCWAVMIPMRSDDCKVVTRPLQSRSEPCECHKREHLMECGWTNASSV